MSDTPQEPRRPGHVWSPEQPVPEHLRPAPPAPEPKRRLRDVDTAEHVFTLKAYAWGGYLGILGMFVGLLLSDRYGWNPFLTVPAGLVLGTVFAGGLAKRIAGAGGRFMSTIYLPSGASTPGARQYSLADSLAVRGRFFDAAAELERCAAQWPEDVEPKLRLARLYRDALQQPEQAVSWFRRILDLPELPAATEQAVTRELIEVYTHRLQRPRAAAPWLARLAERHPESTAGAWAKRTLAELKREMREET